jgi:hypothetical protein
LLAITVIRMVLLQESKLLRKTDRQENRKEFTRKGRIMKAALSKCKTAELKRFTSVNKESAGNLLATAERKQVLLQGNSLQKEIPKGQESKRKLPAKVSSKGFRFLFKKR